MGRLRPVETVEREKYKRKSVPEKEREADSWSRQ